MVREGWLPRNAPTLGRSHRPVRPTADWLRAALRKDLSLRWGTLHVVRPWPGEPPRPTVAKHPLAWKYPKDRAYFDVYIQASHDFLGACNESFQALATGCSCGAPLDAEDGWDFGRARRILPRCAECGTPLDPKRYIATDYGFITGEKKRTVGIGIFRFGLIVDCGKCWPRELCTPGQAAAFDEAVSIRPELVRLVEDELETAFYQLGTGG